VPTGLIESALPGGSELPTAPFHDEDAAREHLEKLLWPQGPVCPRCGVMGDRITKLQGKSTRPGVYKYKDCRKPFSVTVGTVMERSHIPLSKWVLAAQLMSSSKKSMSAHQLHRMLGTNYETAWFLFHRLREAAADLGDDSGPLGGENKVVEADEAYIGGKARNKAFGPIPKKMAVFTLVEREGRAHSSHVADVTAKTLREAIVTRASRKSYLMTDETPVYQKIGEEFAGHGTVNSQRRGILSRRLLVHQQRRRFQSAAQTRSLRAIPPCQRGPSVPLPRRSRLQVQLPLRARLQRRRARRGAATRNQGQAASLSTA
jgi:transposase-like protein